MNLSEDEDMVEESRQLPFEKMIGRDFPCWLVPPSTLGSLLWIGSGLDFFRLSHRDDPGDMEEAPKRFNLNWPRECGEAVTKFESYADGGYK